MEKKCSAFVFKSNLKYLLRFMKKKMPGENLNDDPIKDAE